MKIKFYKMQGAGNDFILVDNRELRIPAEKFPALARRLCSRRLSVGADALMIADYPEHGGDVKMLFYNSDGSLGEMCGNGARCIGRYGYEHFAAKNPVVIEATAGDVPAYRESERIYRVLLNKPSEVRPMVCTVDGTAYEAIYVVLGDPGIPHLVVRMPGLADMDYEARLSDVGSKLRYYAELPKGANVNFYDVLGENHVVIRTFERGVEGFTLACGTGSGSTGVAMQLKGEAEKNEKIRLDCPGGTVWVQPTWQNGRVEQLDLIGPTNIVVDGYITDEDVTEL